MNNLNLHYLLLLFHYKYFDYDNNKLILVKELNIGFNKDIYSSCGSEDEKFKYIIKLIIKERFMGNSNKYINVLRKLSSFCK